MSKFNRLLKLFNEWIGLPIALVLYFIGPSFIRLIDPEAGSFDSGQLNIIFFGVIKVLVASSVAWLGYRLNFPKLYGYFIETMENDFLKSNDTTKYTLLTCAKYSLFIYFAYMLLVIWSLQTV
ncbi:hypothetical protein Q0590_25005 [Rhodocytophaga aerolata]|uniref:Uncharacterized protein n=1 Tax=Rhodocytophaga aerolata TaxID=455078 RepID=A0ABT8RFJ9_9BACT|nr:hypothetical protein [Rhodocytophaga aerolata]MDO1449560.1 hypothetical protein [Rhodocytophaga aerolata]